MEAGIPTHLETYSAGREGVRGGAPRHTSDGSTIGSRSQIAAAARAPHSYDVRERAYLEAGGLMSYGRASPMRIDARRLRGQDPQERQARGPPRRPSSHERLLRSSSQGGPRSSDRRSRRPCVQRPP